MDHNQILLAFGLYFLILLSIGIISHHKLTTSKDFIVGNRSLNFWLTALSAHASDMSVWLFMAYPMGVFVFGLPYIWTAVGLCLGMFFNWQFISKRLRIETERLESYTLSGFFAVKYKDNSGVIRFLTASMTLVFMTIYLSAGLIAMGLLFESVFQIDYYIGISIATVVIVIYTFFGGFVTVAWTDLFQAIFLIIMVLLVPLIAYFNLENGFQTIEQYAAIKNTPLTLMNKVSILGVIDIIFIMLGWGLGYFGMPHIITKFMGIKNPQDLNKSKYLGMTWQVFALGGASLVGLIGIGFFKGAIDNPNLIFIEMVKIMFHPFLAGFILCALIAANMSTMDSQILVCASVISEDFYKHIGRRKASERRLLLISRLGVVIVALISLMLALDKNSSILQTVYFAWSGLGSTFGPLLIMSLYSKRMNKYGAIAGILVGGSITFFWSRLNPLLIDYEIPVMIPAYILSPLSIWLVSRLTYVRERTIV